MSLPSIIFRPLLVLGGLLLHAGLCGQLLPKPEGAFRIAVLGCHRQFEPAPALARYLETEPDLCLWIGDNVYADAPQDPSYIQRCYDALAAKPAFQQMMTEFDYMATWDDHDFGLNNAGRAYPFKAESKEMFRRFWGLEETLPAEQEGIYYARHFTIGEHRLQVIMLDVRYQRDEPSPTGDVLGEAQWQWLEARLREPADLRVLVSGSQILLNRDSGSETWDEYPEAKERLFTLIRESQAERVVFLTGDQHYGEVCRLRDALDFDAVELQFAGINQIEDPEFNPLRVAPAIRSLHSVAVIDLQMAGTAEEVPHLLFRIADAITNQTELTYRVNLSEISLELDFSAQRYFAERHEVQLRHHYPRLTVHYTLDGSEPTATSARYTGPITLDATTTIKARFFDEAGHARSRVFARRYERLAPLAAVRPSGPLVRGPRYAYYEGDFTDLPDFGTLTPKAQGRARGFEPDSLAERDDHYALTFEGYVEAPTTGVYEFFTVSDDGSMLYIGDRAVVDNGGSHSRRLRTGLISLEKGLHPIRITYFEDYSGQTLRVGYVDPAGERVELRAQALFSPAD